MEGLGPETPLQPGGWEYRVEVKGRADNTMELQMRVREPSSSKCKKITFNFDLVQDRSSTVAAEMVSALRQDTVPVAAGGDGMGHEDAERIARKIREARRELESRVCPASIRCPSRAPPPPATSLLGGLVDSPRVPTTTHRRSLRWCRAGTRRQAQGQGASSGRCSSVRTHRPHRPWPPRRQQQLRLRRLRPDLAARRACPSSTGSTLLAR